jgi:hypothetical protein
MVSNPSASLSERGETGGVHCKKGYRFSRPQPGCHLPNSPWPGIIKLFPAREVWLVTSRLGTGKTITFFTVLAL